MSDSLLAAGATGGPGLDLETLVRQIDKAPPKMWTRLRSALGVKDKPAAIQLVQEDPQAAKVARAIVGVEAQEAAPAVPMATAESGRTRPAGRGQVRF